MNTRNRGRLLSSLLTVILAFLVGSVVLPGAAHASSAVGGQISSAEVLARAQWWINTYGVIYSQDQADAKPDGDGHSYRPDCSGFVSMAWHLPKLSNGLDRNTDTLDAGDTEYRASLYDLQPADAILGKAYRHVALFDRWVDAGHTQMYVYEEFQTGQEGRYVIKARSWYEANGFRALHYKKVKPASGSGALNDGVLRVYSRGTDGLVHQSYWTGATWVDGSIGVSASGNPSALHDDVLRVYYQSSDGNLHQSYWNGISWVHSSVGIPIASDPGAVDDGVLRVFARGTDGNLHQIYWTGTGWANQSLGIAITGAPAAIYDGVLRVYARGSDGDLHQFWWSGTAWVNDDTGIPIAGDPTALDDGLIRVFTRSATGWLHQIYWSGGWHDQDLGISIASDPAAVDDGVLRVFARVSGGALNQIYWNGSAWINQTIIPGSDCSGGGPC
jgi:hypothetical protein